MAFIPDAALIDAKTELISEKGQFKHAALILYCYYCLRRNSKSGVCFPSLSQTSVDLGLPKSNVSQLRSFLFSKGWIEILSNGQIKPLKGFVLLEPQNGEGVLINRTKGSNKTNGGVLINRTKGSNKTNAPILEVLTSPITKKDNQPINQHSAISENGNAPIAKTPDENLTLDTDAETQRHNDTAIPPQVEKPTKAEKNPRGTRIPDDFALTDDLREWARETTPDVDVEKETDEFVDYWQSVSVRATKRDWSRTWKTRMREIQRRYDENARRAQAWREQRDRERLENQKQPVRNKTDVIKHYDYSSFDSIEFH